MSTANHQRCGPCSTEAGQLVWCSAIRTRSCVFPSVPVLLRFSHAAHVLHHLFSSGFRPTSLRRQQLRRAGLNVSDDATILATQSSGNICKIIAHSIQEFPLFYCVAYWESHSQISRLQCGRTGNVIFEGVYIHIPTSDFVTLCTVCKMLRNDLSHPPPLRSNFAQLDSRHDTGSCISR